MRYAVKLSTYACYETLLDTHILPEFGDMPLKYISSASVYSFSEKLKQQGLSPRTIKNLLILFHSILRYGEKQGVSESFTAGISVSQNKYQSFSAYFS